MDQYAWNAYEANMRPKLGDEAQEVRFSKPTLPSPFSPASAIESDHSGVFRRFTPSLNVNPIVPLRLPSFVARNGQTKSGQLYHSPLSLQHAPSTSPLPLTAATPSLQSTIPEIVPVCPHGSPQQAKSIPLHFSYPPTLSSLSVPTIQADSHPHTSFYPFTPSPQQFTPIEPIQPHSYLLAPLATSPLTYPRLVPVVAPTQVLSYLVPQTSPFNDLPSPQSKILPVWPDPMDKHSNSVPMEENISQGPQKEVLLPTILPTETARPHSCSISDSPPSEGPPSIQPPKPRSGRFEKIDRPTGSFFASLASSTTPQINQLLQSFARPSVQSQDVDCPSNSSDVLQASDSRDREASTEVLDPISLPDAMNPSIEFPSDEVVDMELEELDPTEEVRIEVGESFTSSSALLDALETVEQMIMMTDDAIEMELPLIEDQAEAPSLEMISVQQVPSSAFTDTCLPEVSAGPPYPSVVHPLEMFFQAVRSMAYGFQAFRADFQFLRSEPLSHLPLRESHPTRAIEPTQWPSAGGMYSKITSIEEIEDPNEDLELPSSYALFDSLLHGSPQQAFRECDFDGEESVSESITMEARVNGSTSTEDSQVLRSDLVPQLRQLKHDTDEWALFPTAESCPLGVGFLLALLTSPRPLAQSFPKPRASTTETLLVEPVVSEAPKKKRRATLHPNILAPAAKKSKLSEDSAQGFW